MGGSVMYNVTPLDRWATNAGRCEFTVTIHRFDISREGGVTMTHHHYHNLLSLKAGAGITQGALYIYFLTEHFLRNCNRIE